MVILATAAKILKFLISLSAAGAREEKEILGVKSKAGVPPRCADSGESPDA
jgi:hypothetical protein